MESVCSEVTVNMAKEYNAYNKVKSFRNSVYSTFLVRKCIKVGKVQGLQNERSKENDVNSGEII